MLNLAPRTRPILPILLTIVFIMTAQRAALVGAQDEAGPETSVVAGCKTAYFLMEDLKEGYRQKSNVTLVPQRTGNKVASKLLAAGDIDFAFTCEPQENLIKKFALAPDTVRNWKSKRFARDPVVVVVNRNNPVNNLTLAQLTDIFSGKTVNWKEVGGPDMDIKISYQDDSLGSGVLGVFKENTVGSKGEITDRAQRFLGPKKRGAHIAQNVGGITFMGLGAFRGRYGKVILIDGIAPIRANIINGSYPLAATYYIIYDTEKSKGAEKFLDYLSTDTGQLAIDRNFISDVEGSR